MSETNSSRVDLEAARDAIRVKGAPPETKIADENVPDGTRWDKPAPTAPPNAKGIEVPPHLGEISAFFQEIVLSESLVLEMCFDHSINIVTDAVNRRLVGTDNFAGDGENAMGPFTPTHYAGIAAPLAVELYKNVIISIGAQEDRYKELTKRAAEKLEDLRKEADRVRQKNPIGKSGIIIP
jgi:hypothetical protein